MIRYKMKDTELGKMLFLCDENLIGKSLIDKKKNISLKIDENFYVERGSEELIESLVKEASFINATGKKSVNIVKKFIKIKSILYINKIPHVQIYEI